MSWMKVDDRLHAHRKTRILLRSNPDGVLRDAAPMGLWVLAGSWAGQNDTTGWIPVDELERFDDNWKGHAERLVAADFWWPEERSGEAGYAFIDWTDWNISKDRQSEDGKYGNHVKWHVKRGIVKPGCEFCPEDPESGSDSPPDSGAISGADRVGDSGLSPTPTRPEPDPNPKTPLRPKSENEREDVERICQHLADRIEANGSKRPAIVKGWRTSARLLLDRDGRTEEQVHRAIDWCQDHDFWRSNILSMPKLREKYDQIRLQAQQGQAGNVIPYPTDRPPAAGEIAHDGSLLPPLPKGVFE
ncbi:hypothetical protein [Pimelobacter simplex]|uniref:Protein gp49, replication initiation n=2 Tax=Nocardioides simplex TaxID=2045 RepID=A0A0C5WYX3_NOCSI|nr:hypothetical protein [Pimelobacter simplex]AJR18523.1 Protein gp49, replication initiation [Pimelobacter simplex]GEB17048.1 hypothetical protein NSI01_53630 [Pimelobacter simplex]SFM76772.1 hypothetical protein SAMN05421671_3423 [Pimelobacter simplex]